MSNFVTKISDSASGYILTSAEQENNAGLIYNILSSYGWTLAAVAGALGNMETESSINPGTCQIGYGIPSGSSVYYSGGLGLIQWTSSPNAILWFARETSHNWYDGVVQCILLENADNSNITSCGTGNPVWGWIPTSSYNISYSQYRAYTGSPEDAASAFLYNMERPADPSTTVNARRDNARKWYNYLSGVTPDPPDPPDPPIPPVPSGAANKWMLFKFDDLRKGNYERH